MDNIYILYDNHYLIEDIKKNNKTKAIFIEISFFKGNILLKILRKIYIKLNLPFKDIFLNKKELQKHNIKENDIVIFFDNLSPQYIDLSKKIKGRKKLWIWNTINESIVNNNNLKYFFKEIYTFDKSDAFKYDFKYLNQFYWKSIKKAEKLNIDLFFIGQDKDRIRFLYELDSKIKLNNFIYVIRDKKKIYNKKYEKYLKENFLSYENVVKKIFESICLIEITKKGQIGLTLRALEALFFEKKLITDNKDIINYDFYNENNIFIIDFENLTNKTIKKIEEFLKKDYIQINEEILEKYTFEYWLKEICKY